VSIKLPRTLLLLLLAAVPALPAATKPIAEFTAGMRKIDGFMPLYWSAGDGKLYLEISRWNKELLFVASLPAGVGSNDIGLDRGLITEPHLVEFERIGPKVLLIEINTRFRSSSSNPMETRAVQDSFATSALWGFEVSAADGDRVLVDAAKFFQHDFVGVTKMIADAKQGTYQSDDSRSAFYFAQTKGFPNNSEVESILTFGGANPGKYLKEVAPSPDSITVREHYSLIALPDDNTFQPRAFDPRAGYFDLTYRDYSAPLGDDLDKRLILRHRLQKRDPNAEVSEPVRPIIYYVDGGAPEDVRNALVEGASWWDQAFEAAGFRNAFQVRVLPPDIDPMDIRYNVIQWVHRFTRGWSYGNAIADPRTGEILKGQVTLGSLRYRQDYLIFSSLLAPFSSDPEPLTQVKAAVYARLRQLAAHETGHTLGLAHNYIASTHDRASVMDYPHPLINIESGGTLSLADAYATGIGSWDKVAIRYGYTQFAPGTDDKAELNKIILDAAHDGNIFITDADSRPLGSAHPKSHLWDNGADAAAELQRLLKVRRIALEHFGEKNIPVGQPMSTLDETLVPLYFLHRYQTEAAAKVLGGLSYTYALRGDGQLVTQIVPSDQQRRALAALLETVSPETLTIPERILKLIPPHPPAYDRTRESFPSQTGLTFDPVAGAEAAASLTGSLLFNPERDARLIEYHARDATNPSFTEVLDRVAKATWFAPAPAGLPGAVKSAVDTVLFDRALGLLADVTSSAPVRSAARAWFEAQSGKLPAALSRQLVEFEKNPKGFTFPQAPAPPPGQPIGEDDFVIDSGS
jgi:hypothetical protein